MDSELEAAGLVAVAAAQAHLCGRQARASAGAAMRGRYVEVGEGLICVPSSSDASPACLRRDCLSPQGDCCVHTPHRLLAASPQLPPQLRLPHPQLGSVPQSPWPPALPAPTHACSHLHLSP